MIPIYIAAPWIDRARVKTIAEEFKANGFVPTEEWWNHPDTTDQEELQRQALKDYYGVKRSDAVVLLNFSKSEGKAAETGLALAWGIPVILVGAKTNIFHHMPEVAIVATVEEALNELRGQGQR